MSSTPMVIDRATVVHEAAPAPRDSGRTPPRRSPDLSGFLPAKQAPRPGRPGPRITRSVLALVPLNAGTGCLSLAVIREEFACDSTLCATATLDRHPGATLALSALYLVALLVVAVLTRGLAEFTRAHLAAFGALTTVGVLAASGTIAITFVLAALIVAAATPVTVFLLTIIRYRPFTPHR
ncbi:hypothetical protein GCM10022223_03280 [Kineosporia mesophila]|uniref:Integral membrane protein n=1 Tax=Kineosporia mesophila TaxID=566012 RepID=A0ABP6YWW1_9ACTN|nr:hypothetical protein [Kineosporia mesophila]MCD5351813.1 hypothetical protein [Kineosporia mesophila]